MCVRVYNEKLIIYVNLLCIASIQILRLPNLTYHTLVYYIVVYIYIYYIYCTYAADTGHPVSMLYLSLLSLLVFRCQVFRSNSMLYIILGTYLYYIVISIPPCPRPPFPTLVFRDRINSFRLCSTPSQVIQLLKDGDWGTCLDRFAAPPFIQLNCIHLYIILSINNYP